jgi:hypothetical protein
MLRTVCWERYESVKGEGATKGGRKEGRRLGGRGEGGRVTRKPRNISQLTSANTSDTYNRSIAYPPRSRCTCTTASRAWRGWERVGQRGGGRGGRSERRRVQCGDREKAVANEGQWIFGVDPNQRAGGDPLRRWRICCLQHLYEKAPSAAVCAKRS